MTPTAPWRDPISGRWIEPAKPVVVPAVVSHMELMDEAMKEEKAKIHAEHVWRQVVDIASGTNAPTRGVPPVIPPVVVTTDLPEHIEAESGYVIWESKAPIWFGLDLAREEDLG